MTVPVIHVTAPVGPAGAPLVLLGPSLGTSTLVWDPVAAILGSRFRVAAWDLPGHGASPATTLPFTVGELALAVLDTLDALHEDRVHSAGLSLGGAVGLELMLAAPHRVIAAAEVCTGAKIGTVDGWITRAATVRAQGTASLVGASAARWFAPGSIARHPELAGRLLNSLRDADDISYALCAEALAGYDVRGKLGNIEAPVLAVWGEHDLVTPESSSLEIAEGVVRGRVERVADAGHLAPAEQPEVVAGLLAGFFEGAE